MDSHSHVKAACGTPVFAYCSSREAHYYYSRDANACVSTRSAIVGVCNRSPNRFSTAQSCRQHCLDKSEPSKQCLESAVFTECSREDVAETWWHFRRNRCRRWNFPAGLCPVIGSSASTSFRECARRCTHGGSTHARAQLRMRSGGNSGNHPPCRLHRGDVCGVEQLRFPYFADSTANTSKTASHHTTVCREVSSVHDTGNLCLVGANRFRTASACRQACVSGAEKTEVRSVRKH
ncbi:uncharacterized protein LOC144159887 [Haemaphysalis longicornis]